MAGKDTGFKGAGTASIAIKKTDGTFDGWQTIGNVEMFEVSPESDQQTRESYQEETYGQALDTDITAKPTKVKFKFDTMTAANLALALSSALVANDVKTAGTVTGETHTAYKGKKIRLNHEFVTSVIITGKTSGTDFIQDTLNSQFIEIPETSTIVDGAEISVAYSYAGYSQDLLLGGLTSFEAKMEVNGINRLNNTKFMHHLGKVTLTSNGGFGFLGKDFAKAEMDGIANIDNDPASPSYGHAYITRFNVVPSA